ncbi:hypothetical protein K8Q93_02190 [Candidatus Parcubacteria bacterium]|nr:hypothetical protein [Candidatus Parcubacteria bacterium]
MSMEDNFIRRIDSNRRGQNQEKRLSLGSAIAREAVLSKKAAIDPEGFRDLYGSGVDVDQKHVGDVKRQIEAQQAQELDEQALHEYRKTLELASALEFLVCEGIRSHGWLGTEATAVKTAEYDDLFNGVDLVAEFKQKTGWRSHLGLAIDVAFGGGLEKKIMRVKSEIDKGVLPKIKYFALGDFRGELKGVPRVVAGLDGKATLGLAQLWEEQRVRFASHPVQYTLLYEMRLQLKVFGEYAAKTNKPEIAEAYGRALALLEEVMRQKEREQGRPQELTSSIDTVRHLEGALHQVFNY